MEYPATRHLFASEDAETIHQMLSGGYHAVVANPPYITPKDPAASAAYRRRYRNACYGQYHLSAPFMERLFDLAVRGAGDHPAGFVGQITDNAFMKRSFGKPLIENFLAQVVCLTHVIDTSGAHIPDHGTPTAILFGRNSPPIGDTLRAVQGIRGEPSRPDEPAKGEVWTSVTDLVDRPGSENDYVSVVDLGRARLAKHPWSIQGGGADALKGAIEVASATRLFSAIASIGFASFPGLDDAFVMDRASLRRRGVDHQLVKAFIRGDIVRDWSVDAHEAALVPYDEQANPVPLDRAARWARHLWPLRSSLGGVLSFGGMTRAQQGDDWWLWYRWVADRYRTPLSIPFAFVATHNQFVIDRGGKVFKQSAPVIKLPARAGEEEHLALVGLPNSAVACFWLKQIFHGKGGGGIGGGIASEEWEEFFEFDGTKLKQFPIPAGSVLGWARRLDDSARELSDNLPAGVAGRSVPTRNALDAARGRVEGLRAEMVATQEELDWRCLHLYGVTPDDLSLQPGEAPPLERGQRAFEIVMAKQMAAGELRTTWFERHGSTPILVLPPGWPEGYKRLVERRIELIESDRFVGLVERPECKRRWNWAAWEDLEREALCAWLLDRLEEPRYWPDSVPRSGAQLADVAGRDAAFVQVTGLYAGTIDVDLTDLVSALVKDEAVPYLAAWRYTESGLRTRAAWERTWGLQRREDAGEDVGTIPVPPKYGQGDLVDKASWKLRGKLDVPKERFVAYPGLGREADPTPLVGWAGWDHLQCAQALATTYEQRRSVDGWSPERLMPILAGLAELVPWLRQWHNDVDPGTGLRLGDFFAEFVATESAASGFGTDDLAAWKPPARTGGRRKGRAAGAT